jgi:hypothetical protein
MLTGRYIIPALLRGYVKHYSKKFYDEMEAERKNTAQKEGEINISGKSGGKKKQQPEDGEYVDYEEIK